MADKISVLLVDDHALVRRGFRRILEDEEDIVVKGEASDGDEAVRLANHLKPDVIVMDCALPGSNGLVATRKILEHNPKAVILMLSMHSEDTWVRQSLEAGARGYMLKNALDLELVDAIRRVAAGEEVLDPQIARRTNLKGERETGLTVRELEVLQLIVGGLVEQGNRQPAQSERQHGGGAPRQHHGRARHPQDGRTGGVRHSQRAGEHPLIDERFLQVISIFRLLCPLCDPATSLRLRG